MIRSCTHTDENYIYTEKVSVSTSDYSYEKINKDTIISLLDFLKDEVQTRLDGIWNEVDQATTCATAFDFDGVVTLAEAREDLYKIMQELNEKLNELYTKFGTDIDNVISEVNNNFDWAKVCSLSIVEIERLNRYPASSN